MPERCALVTGGSRGIGRAASLALAARGYPIVVNYRTDVDGAKQTLAEIEAAGGEGIVVGADVSDGSQVDSLFSEAEDALGPVGVLVNNAGIRRDGLFLRMSDADWHEVMAVNLYGAFACSKRALRSMLRRNFGRIVNVTSVGALRGNPGQANYCAAKAGLIGLTKSLAREVAGRNVTVNAIAPGLIDTELTKSLAPKRYEELVSEIPMRRAGTPQEAAELVSFLCSEEAGYVTGAVFVADGGLTA